MNKRRLFACGAATLVVFAALFVACGGNGDDGGGAKDSPTAKASATTAGANSGGSAQSDFGKRIAQSKTPEDLADGQEIGKPGAKVVVEMYEDFGCPHCLEFTAVVEPMLMDEYVSTGKIQLVYRFFPLHQVTAVAAIGAYCAGEQNRFWSYHKALFVAQAEANEKKGPALPQAFAVDALNKLAGDLGLDAAKFSACLTSDAAVNAVQADLKSANDLGLPGTPAFVINGKVTPGPASVGDWRKLLDSLLK